MLPRPANLGKEDATPSPLHSLIVAGASSPRDQDKESTLYSEKTSGVPHVYAPGFFMQVANGAPGDGGYISDKMGTSEGKYQRVRYRPPFSMLINNAL